MYGGARAVVLLHGQPGSARDWDLVIPGLDDLKVIASDRPGYDGTPAQDFVGNARAVAERARTLGVERLVAVGHSWGGGVALQLALDYPALVAGLCLVGSVGSPLAVSVGDRVLALRAVRKAAGIAVCAAAVAAPGAFARAAGSSLNPAERRLLREAAAHWLTNGAASAFASEQRSLVDEHVLLAQRLGEIKAPSVVLTGNEDRTVRPAASADLVSRLSRGRLITVPGGHLLPVESPDAVKAAIQACVRDADWGVG